MNKIVREHYPVEKLPDDIRQHFREGTSVTLEVSEEPGTPLTVEQMVRLMRENQAKNRGSGFTPERAAEEIRALRDEWED